MDLEKFGVRYARFAHLARFVHDLAPAPQRGLFARLLGRQASPYRGDRLGAFERAMHSALGLGPRQLRLASSAWLENHGIFAVAIFELASLPTGWLFPLIDVAQPQALSTILRYGALVIACHCHHQNLIFAFVGARGGDVWPIAAPARSSLLFPYLGKYIEKINRDSALWFGGGQYLFTDRNVHTVRNVHRALEDKKIVFVLCDFHSAHRDREASGTLFGRFLSPPTGAVSIALKRRRPVFAALMRPASHGLRLTLELEQLDDSGGLPSVLSGYFRFLERRIGECPAAWQGWEWWDSLPTREA